MCQLLNYANKTVTRLCQRKGILVIFWTALTVKSEPTFPIHEPCEPSINLLQHTGKHSFIGGELCPIERR